MHFVYGPQPRAHFTALNNLHHYFIFILYFMYASSCLKSFKIIEETLEKKNKYKNTQTTAEVMTWSEFRMLKLSEGQYIKGIVWQMIFYF